MAGDDRFYPLSVSTTIARTSDSGILTHPALQRRSALRERRPSAVRRHTGRVATRFAVLLAGDVVAIVVARLTAVWLAAETVNGSFALGGTPLVLGGGR